MTEQPGGYIRYTLDPREVTIVKNRDGSVQAYIWEPTSPVPSPLRPAPKSDWLEMENIRGPRRRRWWWRSR